MCSVITRTPPTTPPLPTTDCAASPLLTAWLVLLPVRFSYHPTTHLPTPAPHALVHDTLHHRLRTTTCLKDAPALLPAAAHAPGYATTPPTTEPRGCRTRRLRTRATRSRIRDTHLRAAFRLVLLWCGSLVGYWTFLLIDVSGSVCCYSPVILLD